MLLADVADKPKRIRAPRPKNIATMTIAPPSSPRPFEALRIPGATGAERAANRRNMLFVLNGPAGAGRVSRQVKRAALRRAARAAARPGIKVLPPKPAGLPKKGRPFRHTIRERVDMLPIAVAPFVAAYDVRLHATKGFRIQRAR